MSVSRRQFLIRGGLVTAGFLGLKHFAEHPAWAGPEIGYGELVPDPEKVLDLPKGFSYRIVSKARKPMDDGFLLPGAPDGMATFAYPGAPEKVILIRNHELHPSSDAGPFGKENELFAKIAAEKIYDRGYGEKPALGGTSTLIWNMKEGKKEAEWLSLAGTTRNCAGGPTPWNSWVTCEEAVPTINEKEKVEKDHGYCFEVPATTAPALADPVPLKAMGRFNHEAIAVDPLSGAVYLTEDRADGLIYRFLPSKPGKLAEGGKLQALKVRGADSLDTRNWQDKRDIEVGQTMEVEWVDLEDIEAPKDDLRERGFKEQKAARFARGEGMWYGNDAVYFACTTGGKRMEGQIWRYVPSKEEGKPGEAQAPGKLTLFIEPDDGNILENCDNLTVSPWGDLVLCEDNAGKVDLEGNYIVGVTPEGQCYKFARNVKDDSEFAGAVFSPDGGTLFVNLQGMGRTVAITGPWKKRG